MGRSEGVPGADSGYGCCVGNIVEAREDRKVVTTFSDRGFEVWLVDEDDRTRTLLERVEV